jgi:hypothetical protein
MMVMNWVIATLIMAAVIVWIIIQLQIWRSRELKLRSDKGAIGKVDTHPIWGPAAESSPSLPKEMHWEVSRTVSCGCRS